MAVNPSFANLIKPYFSPCFRVHMLTQAGPQSFDLWDPVAVQNNYGAISNAVGPDGMPLPGCPDSPWDQQITDQFLADFAAWQTAGYPP